MWCCCPLPWSPRRVLEDQLRRCQHELHEAHTTSIDPWKVVDQAAHAVARRYECKLCMNACIEAVFLTCGHAMACLECARRCTVCPVCATEVQSITMLHLM